MSDSDELTDAELDLLRCDVCPDCREPGTGFKSGPRGGSAQNIFCNSCGVGFNVLHPRYVIWGQRIGARQP